MPELPGLDDDLRPDRPWDAREMRAVQLRLRERLVPRPPPGFAPRTVAGADVSASRRSRRGFGGIVVLEAATLGEVDRAVAESELQVPYVPGYFSFRELPALARAWEALGTRPDALVFDGQGTAHPRRFGLACHGGLLFGLPSVGCAKSLLVGEHGPLGHARGSTAPIVDRGETVGVALRTRDGVKPVYVSPGHLMDADTAVALVLSLCPRFREPETTRRAHRAVNDARARGEGAA